MDKLFMIMGRKTVYKHTVSPYFLSDSFQVASWFTQFPPMLGEEPNRLFEVTNPGWVSREINPMVPCVEEGTDVSPRFRVSSFYIYGRLGENLLTDGTVYSSWFYPVLFSPKFTGAVVREARNMGAGVYVHTYLNFWFPTHVFQNYRELP